MLLTTCAAAALNRILFTNDNCDQTLYSYSDHYSKSGPNFSKENGLGGPLFLEFWSPEPIFSPDQNFRDRPCKHQNHNSTMCQNHNLPNLNIGHSPITVLTVSEKPINNLNLKITLSSDRLSTVFPTYMHSSEVSHK